MTKKSKKPEYPIAGMDELHFFNERKRYGTGAKIIFFVFFLGVALLIYSIVEMNVPLMMASSILTSASALASAPL